MKEPPIKCPLALPEGTTFGVPTNRTIDTRLLTGAVIFGLGWGLSGICPGPGLFLASAGVVDTIILWIPGFLVGSSAGKKLIEMRSVDRKKKSV
jgi:uncharacterized membrane protein YedE/YeeE